MEQTKFHNLCMAYSKAQSDFNNFETDCHTLAIQLVKFLKEYLQVPESQFSLYKLSGEGEFEIVPPALINALNLRDDSFWQFGVGLTVCSAPETLPQELILIHILLKKDMDGKYLLKYGNEATEYEVLKEDHKSFNVFFDYIHNIILKGYQEQLQQFIGQNTRRKLGF